MVGDDGEQCRHRRREPDEQQGPDDVGVTGVDEGDPGGTRHEAGEGAERRDRTTSTASARRHPNTVPSAPAADATTSQS